MKIDLEKLNKGQRKAVTHGRGPLLIVAGAGTGKTTVITQRVAYLIEQGRAEPEEILALTFTDKAAQEMEDRVDSMLSQGYVDLWVSTFHSFCHRVIQTQGLDIGLPTDFNLLDDTDSWLLVRRNLDEFDLEYYKPLGNPTRFIHALVSHFNRCKDQSIMPEDYLEYAEGIEEKEERKRVEEVARAYETYQKILLAENSFDFGDLINYTILLFQKRPNILKKYRERFKYILLDEFQDTNWAQYELARMVAAPDNNLTVTADDDQSIYKFRGASFGNILQFKNDYPEADRVSLVKNYRSRQNILDKAYDFIQNNNPNRLEVVESLDKKLIAVRKGEGEIDHLHMYSLEGEVQAVVNKIVEIKNKEEESRFSDFGILVRANKTALPFCRALERAGLPYRFLALKGLYSKPVVLDTLSFFKLLDDYHESASLYRILNLPFINMPEEDTARITRWSNRKSQSIYQTLKQISRVPKISEQAKQKANLILSLIKKHTRLSKKKNVSEVFISFLEESGYLDHLTRTEDRKSIDYVNQFYDKIKRFERAHLDARLTSFMEEVEMELESGEEGRLEFDVERGPDAVRIMTIHKAKGLEFKYVFLVNMVKRRFPTIHRSDPIQIPEPLVKEIVPEGDVHLQEERRLFYVGMTRAKKGLFFSSARDYGGKRMKRVSRFLKELDMGDKEPQKLKKLERTEQEKGEERSFQENLPPYFSFTQFKAFESCPLQYKYAHLLKIPVRGKAVFSYGRTMHNTLERFVRQDQERNLSLEDLMGIYEKEWIEDWFHSSGQRERYFKQGREALKRFYNEYRKKSPSVLSIKGEPALEQSFRFKIGEETVIGKIDRIDKVEKGVELVDYKTGKSRDRLRKKDKEQLLIYQIAAERALGLKPKALTYYYLDDGSRLSFLGGEEKKKKQMEKMKKRIKEIKESGFEPAPGWQCRYCDFKDMCEYAER